MCALTSPRPRRAADRHGRNPPADRRSKASSSIIRWAARSKRFGAPNVVLLVIDATEGITDQDARLARLVDTNDRAMVICVQQMGRRRRSWGARSRRSCATRTSDIRSSSTRRWCSPRRLPATACDGIIPAAIAAGDSWRATFQTSMLNRTLAEATAAMDPPLVGSPAAEPDVRDAGRQRAAAARDFSPMSSATSPRITSAFIETRFRKALGLVGTPLRLEFRRTGRTWVQGASAARRRAAGARNVPRRDVEAARA